MTSPASASRLLLLATAHHGPAAAETARVRRYRLARVVVPSGVDLRGAPAAVKPGP